MKTANKGLNYKLGLLKLAVELNNVSLACKIFGCSSPTYYRYKKAYLEGGDEALLDVSRKNPNPKNQVSPHIAEAVLSLSLAHPEFGKPSKVPLFTVLRDKKLGNRVNFGVLEVFGYYKFGETETHYPGYLVAQDTCYIGYLKGVGFVYLQTAINTYSKVAFAKLYVHKNAVVAADLLRDKVVPFFEENGLRVQRILTATNTNYSLQTRASSIPAQSHEVRKKRHLRKI